MTRYFALLSKALHLDWGNLLRILSQLKRESGRGRLDLFRDMMRCYKEDGFTWLSYASFGFHRLTDPAIRASYLSQGDTDDNVMLYNTRESFAILRDKGEQYRTFRDFLGRDFLDLRQDDFAAFAAFLERHPIVFAKVPENFGGQGIRRIKSAEVDDRKTLYDDLLASRTFIVEEAIRQHEDMSRLSLHSVNTIRIATTIGPDGTITVPYMSVRASLSDAFVDNGTVGGAWTLVSDFRSFQHPFFTNVNAFRTFAKNPLTGFTFKGFKVPFAEETVAFVKRLAATLPEARYVGWDIAIGEEGPLMIEANFSPSVELYQVHGMMADDLGLAPAIEEGLGLVLRRRERKRLGLPSAPSPSL